MPAVAAGLVVLLTGGGAFTARTTGAFEASTASDGNEWTVEVMTLADDDSGTALFSLSGLQPGDSGTRCLTVTWSGSTPAQVRLYGAGGTGTLGGLLALTVEEGSGATGSGCGGFTPVTGATSWTGTAATLPSSWASGLGTWSPSGGTASRSYRIGWVLADDDAAAGRTFSTAVTVEARGL